MTGTGKPGILDTYITAWRLRDAQGDYPIYDDEGASLYPGRWNSAGVPMIYAAANHSTALLEKLVRLNFVLPKAMHFITISIPAGTSYEVFAVHDHPGWDSRSGDPARDYGDAWVKSGRSALLFVPSVPARFDRNILLNRRHPDAARFTHSLPEPVPWDRRLFSGETVGL